jgi:hypothetical protein
VALARVPFRTDSSSFHHAGTRAKATRLRAERPFRNEPQNRTVKAIDPDLLS